MRICIRDRAQTNDIDIADLGPGTIGDLVRAAGFEPLATDVVRVGDHTYDLDEPLNRLRLANGLQLTIGPADDPGPRPSNPTNADPAASLLHIAGWASSGSIEVEPGEYGLAPSPGPGLNQGQVDDPAFFLRVTTTGAQAIPGDTRDIAVERIPAADVHNARNRTITIGDNAFRVTDPLPRGVSVANTLWNRPTRTRSPERRMEIVVPPRPDAAKTRQALSWAAMLAPIPMGIFMAIFFRPMYALFVLMSPVMMLARWIESGRSSKKDKRRFGVEIAESLDGLAKAIGVLTRAETARRHLTQPDLATLRRWAEDGHQRLWERRRGDSDFLCLSPAIADEPDRFDTPLGDASAFPEAEAMVNQPVLLAAVPTLADLVEHGSIGIAGPRDQALGIARALALSAATLHGPADLQMGVVANESFVEDWDFLKWLPHLGSTGGTFRLATRLDHVTDVIPAPVIERFAVGAAQATGPANLTIVDHPGVLAARGSALRQALQRPDDPIHGIILADHPEHLPAACGVIVEINDRNETRVRYPGLRRELPNVRPCAIDVETANDWARSLARYIDPDAAGASGAIAASIRLVDLLPPLDGAALLDNWHQAGIDPKPSGLVGASSVGRFGVDLAADGPHGLIAGTTGSGKSELLRTMVASMACNASPDHLTFVLIDFKGGGAFDVCAGLPHVVSIVTDLDDHLAERALRCLKAELRLREEILRDAGASDLGEFLAAGHGPMPRLVVIIDEFATLAVELPDFLDSLVDIAQRGRSLGVHMILATQRPSGVLDNKVRANTNLRIALRVQDDGDSNDIIGTSQAAKLSRLQPGRAFARLGQTEILEFQTALVTGPWVPPDQRQLTLSPFRLFEPADDPTGDSAASEPRPATTAKPDPESTDIEMIVDAVQAAFDHGGYELPRVPWPDPLSEQIDARTLEPTAADQAERYRAPFAVVDLPDRQRQEVVSWTPAMGTVAMYGIESGSIAAAMSTIAIGLASTQTPENLHLYVVETGAGTLRALERLPHIGSLVEGGDLERVSRLTQVLVDEIAHRKESVGRSEPALTLVLIDSWAAVAEAVEEARDLETMGRLGQIVREGPAVGIYCLIGAAHERAIPNRVASVISHRLLFKLVDSNAYTAFGLKARSIPALGPGRAIDPASQEVMQTARYDLGDDSTEAAVSAIRRQYPTGTGGRAPGQARPIDVLEPEINLATIDQLGGRLDPEQWLLPIAVDGPSLATSNLALGAGEHALVFGPAGSGKSTTLATVATAARQIDPDLTIVAVAHRASPLAKCSALSTLIGKGSDPDRLAEIIDLDRVLILVDDADSTPEEFVAAIQQTLGSRPDQRHLIAACRPDFPKGFDSWVRALRQSKTGVSLQASPGDGDALKISLPLSKPTRFPKGRGFLVNNGVPNLVQVALPPSTSMTADHQPDTTPPTNIKRAEELATTTQSSSPPRRPAPGTNLIIDLGLDSFNTEVAKDDDAGGARVIDLGLDTFSTEPAGADTGADPSSPESEADRDEP